MNPKNLRMILRYLSGDQLHDRNMHGEVCRAFLGNDYDYVHGLKDGPSKYLGKGHRVLFHDQATNIAIALMTGDPKAAIAGALHDMLDFGETRLRYPKKKMI